MATTHPTAFGDALRRYRTAIGLTQEELAERAGLSVRAVSDLERGLRRSPYRATVRMLADALGVPSGEREALEQAARRAARVDEPRPLRSATLPDPVTPFIGREREIADIVALLQQPGVRFITLSGPGGIGKTRVALEVAEIVRDRFPDGVYCSFLASINEPGLVPSVIAQTLGSEEQSGRQILDTLKDFLATRRLLLVLDNFEHLLAARAAVAELLDSCRELHVIVTSRSVLRLAREHQYPIPPMSLPAAEDQGPSMADAVLLFVQRARAAVPDFDLTTENAEAVTNICRRLDGLPLAIELAAARIRLFPPQALLERLSRRLPLLTGGPGDSPARQQTLRGAIDWSYGLLNHDEQRLFARFSVFAGGTGFEAVDAVCGVSAGETLDVVEGVCSLVGQSLLQQEGEDTTRLTMLETIREYAGERLILSGEAELVRRRHAEYFLAVAEEANGAATAPAAMDRIADNHDNIRAALQWACDQGQVDLGLRLAVAMSRFWTHRGLLTEGLRWLGDLLAQPGVDPAMRARGLTAAARLARARRDMASVQDLAEQSLKLSRQIEDSHGMAEAQELLGVAAVHLRDFSRAVQVLENGLLLARRLHDPELVGQILADLCGAQALAGNTDRAREVGEESLRLSHGRDAATEAQCLDALLFVARLQGDSQRASEVVAESAALLTRPGFSLDGASRGGIMSAALAARGWGDYKEAEALLERAIGLSLEVSDEQVAIHLRVLLALIAREQGQYDRAMGLLEHSLAACRAAEDVFGVGRALLGLADVRRDRGDPTGIAALARESLALFRTLGDMFHVAWSLNNLAMAAYLEGDHDRAEVLLTEALPLLPEGDEQAEIMINLGVVALGRGEYADAATWLLGPLRTGLPGRNVGLAATGLDAMAIAASGLGWAERAARLFGAAVALHTSIGTPVLPSLRPLYDRHVEAVKASMGEARFEAAWHEGWAMSREQVIAYALEVGDNLPVGVEQTG